MSTYSAAVIALVPKAYWRLGEGAGPTAVDQMALQNGTYAGGVTFASTPLVAGDAATSVLLNGSTGVVNCTNHAQFQNASGTIMVWVKTLEAGSFKALLTKQNAYGIFVSAGTLLAWDWGAGAARDSGYIINDGRPHFVCLTFGGGTGNLYVDGRQVGPANFIYNVLNQTVQLLIGSGNTSGQFVAGNIQEAAVFSTVLTAAQINSLYAIGGPAANAAQTNTAVANTLSLGSNVAAGNNRYLVAQLGLRRTASQIVTSVVWTPFGGAAQPLTLVQRRALGTATVGVETWAKIAPTVGAGTIVATIASGLTASFVLAAHALVGVDQTTPWLTSAGATGASTTPNVDIGSSTGETVLDVVAVQSAVPTLTANGGQTQQWQAWSRMAADTSNVRAAASTKPGTPALVNTGYVDSASVNWAIQSISIRPSTATPLTALAVIPYEALKHLQLQPTVRYEALKGLTQQSNFQLYEALKALTQQSAVPYEAVSGLQGQAAIVYEALLALRPPGTLNYEALKALTQSKSAAYEALKAGTKQAGVSYEALLALRGLAGIPYDGGIPAGATIPVSQLAIIVYEALLSVRATGIENYEAIKAVTGSRAVPYEAIKVLTQTGLISYEALLRLTQSRAMPYEALLHLAPTRVISYEAFGRLSRQALFLYEALKAIRTTGIIPYDGGVPSGVTTVFKQTPLDIIEHNHALFVGVSLFLDVMLSTSNVLFAAQARLEVSIDGGTVWTPLIVASSTSLPVAIDPPTNSFFIGERVRSAAVSPGLIPAQSALYRVTLGGQTNAGTNVYRIYHGWGLITA